MPASSLPALPPLPRRRSPLAPRLDALGAAFAPFGGDSALAETIAHKASALVLCDLSPLARVGVKGGETASLLRRANLVAPSAVNASALQKDGSLCLRLAKNEVLLLSALASKGKGDFAALHREHARSRRKAFLVPYQDSLCWLALAGAKASELLATMCAVDMREQACARGTLTQTSLARLSALILRDPNPASAKRPLFHILADSASALYLWDGIIDAMLEHEGAVCGRQDLLRFLRAKA